MPITELWINRVKNKKTGDMPTLYQGATPTETAASCIEADCPLLPVSAGGTAEKGDVRCYAWAGTPRMGLAAAQRSRAAGKKYSLTAALENRSPKARAIRLAAIGDPVSLGRVRMRKIADMADQAGLALIAYTHAWRHARWLRPYAVASCDTPEQADEAVDAGWRAAVVLTDDFLSDGRRVFARSGGKKSRTPGGKPILICPAQQLPGRVTCNQCRLCDASVNGPIIGFIEHGPGSKARRGKP